MTDFRVEEAARARAALIVAASRRTLLTYGELGQALDWGKVGSNPIELRNKMGRLLDDVSEVCRGYKEPSLAALVVRQATGESGSGGFTGEERLAIVQKLYKLWQSA